MKPDKALARYDEWERSSDSDRCQRRPPSKGREGAWVMADLLWVCEGQSVHDGAWIVDHPRGYQIRIPKHMDFLPLVEELNHAALRAQLAEAEAERDRLSAAIMPKGCPKFAEGIDPVVMLDEERKVWRDEIDAISTALAASESKRKVLATECKGFRYLFRVTEDAKTMSDVQAAFEQVRLAAAATDAASALEEPR